MIHFYRKADLDRVRRAMAQRVDVPNYPDLVHVAAAADECGVSMRTLRRRYHDWSKQPVPSDQPARSIDGRALPRSYLPREFVAWLWAEQNARPSGDKISVEQAALVLDLTSNGVHALIRYGVLHATDGRIVCKGGYLRKGKVLSRKEVETYRKQKNEEIKPEPFRDKEGTWLPWPLVRDAATNHHRRACASGNACLEAALDYLRRGWSALALCPPDHVGVGRSHGKGCSSPGKAPWGDWKEYQERLPTEAELRDKWQALPNANVGVALGPVSGLMRIDVDGPAGEAMLAELSDGDLPETLEFVSGR